MTKETQNLNIDSIKELPSPKEVINEVPVSDQAIETVVNGRQDIENILTGKDKRVLLVIGPCSIHDTEAAMEYARRLKQLQDKFSSKIMFVMRVYFRNHVRH